MKRLRDLLYKVGMIRNEGDLDLPITHITADSREVREGSLFIAVRGTKSDGHHHIPEALAKGAIAIISEEEGSWFAHHLPKTWIQVQNSRIALGQVAANWYNRPGDQMKLIGITGTNGKTTTAWFISQLRNQMGEACALFSTIQIRIGNETFPASLTTPDPIQFHHLLAQAHKQGIRSVVMEVSSHALDQYRVEGVYFKQGIFTNLTRDHLDYHKTMEAYRDAKKRLFDLYLTSQSAAITNRDDPNGRYMVQNTYAKVFFYDRHTLNTIPIKVLETSPHGTVLLVDRRHEVTLPFVGTHNLSNWLAAALSLLVDHADLETILVQSTRLQLPPGRMEPFFLPSGATAFVDYAHTPDALRNILETLLSIKPQSNQLILVVGAGGNRDRSKRPLMGKIACMADHVIFTSDNPRDENPYQIVQEMMESLSWQERQRCEVEINRRDAILKALSLAHKGDLVLIAGKGHETYQEIHGVKYPFRDQDVVTAFIQNQHL